MESKYIAMIFFMLLFGSCIGYSIGFIQYSPQINNLEVEVSKIQSNYLLEYQDNLKIQNEFRELENQYTQLLNEKNNILTNYNKITNEYQQMLENYKNISGDIQDFREDLLSYCQIPYSFTRTLTTIELEKISSIVKVVTSNSLDQWYAYNKIYEYIATNIKSYNDVDFPYISGHNYIIKDGVTFINNIDTSEISNYIKTPENTIKDKTGDCDDQSTLEYAMIKYYNNYIRNVKVSIYFVDIDSSNGPGHISVFIPIQGGKICILDPALKYKTSQSGLISAKIASSELSSYQSYYNLKTGTNISKITVYEINVEDGSYNKIYSGNYMDAVSIF